MRTQPVRAVTNKAYVSSYYGRTVNGVLGVKTAYCVGPTLCPSWVTMALTASFIGPRDSTNPAATSEETPLPVASAIPGRSSGGGLVVSNPPRAATSYDSVYLSYDELPVGSAVEATTVSSQRTAMQAEDATAELQ
ncbi:hypothetical protein BKD30_13025 [Tersicoccus phoenicis]|uniref:Uncharacterized protein n=1 Tax=Tersicoccus phoenicis TaxID=554083 RepID=A0A1R1L6U9_9MICC|nr:hypothetical protein [Tersicoccus phoenicis]OMH23271.1 hypothetical protein BKD30_13025 [Tersicoccus phoenicis]